MELHISAVTRIWSYTLLELHLSGATHIWRFTYLEVHRTGATHIWSYTYMGVEGRAAGMVGEEERGGGAVVAPGFKESFKGLNTRISRNFD